MINPDICLLCKTQKIGYVLRHKSKPWLIGLCRDCYKSSWEESNHD